MRTIDFSRFGTRVGTRMEGKKAQHEIELELAEISFGETIIFDLKNLELLGYSFADEAIAVVFQRLVANEYGDKFIVICCDNKDILDGIESALERRGLVAMAIQSNEEWFLLGKLKDYQRETLEIIMKEKEIRTPDLANKLDISAPACNNRLTELSRLKIINRSQAVSGERGLSYTNKSII